MQRFNIYKKSKKITWNNTLIIGCLIFALYLISLLKHNFFNLEKEVFDEIILKLMLGLIFIGFILKTIGLVKQKKLNGEFSGFLEFHKEYIAIDMEKFKIDEIKSIEISNNDYYGKLNDGKGFEKSLSNGINNQILLILNSGAIKSYNFELYNEYDIGKNEKELVFYYSRGKIEFSELIKILKIKNKLEIEEYRIQINQSLTINR